MSSPQADLTIYLKFRPVSEIGGESKVARKRGPVQCLACPSSTELSGEISRSTVAVFQRIFLGGEPRSEHLWSNEWLLRALGSMHNQSRSCIP